MIQKRSKTQSKKISDKASGALLLVLPSGVNSPTNWKGEAKRRIRESDCVLVILGKSGINKNLGWEIRLAQKKRKQIFVLRLHGSPNNGDLPSYLFAEDPYLRVSSKKTKAGGGLRPCFKEISIEDFSNIAKRGYDFDVSIEINNTKNPKRMSDIAEQYKAYLETSESVVTRRNNTSSFYISLNTGLVTAGASITGIIFGINRFYKNVPFFSRVMPVL